MSKDRSSRPCGCDPGAQHFCLHHDRLVRDLEKAGVLEMIVDLHRGEGGEGTCPREHQGFDLLMQKLLKEPLHGYKPLLPEPQFGQDVAMVAHLIDRLRNRIRQSSLRLEGIAKELTGV
jgi:hypothetical protein